MTAAIPSLNSSNPALADGNGDALNKIITANALEQSGDREGAIALYREILAQDQEITYREIAQKALENLVQHQPTDETIQASDEALQTVEALTTKSSPNVLSRWQRLSLKTKATALMIALSTLPVFGIGAIAYYFANQSITQQITNNQKVKAINVADQINRFLLQRYADIQAIASLPMLTDPAVGKLLTLPEKQAILNRYLDAYGVYNSIAALDLKGNVIVQSIGKPLGNLGDRAYFRKAIATQGPVITDAEISKLTGKIVIFVAAPIKDSKTGAIIGVVRTRIPINELKNVISQFEEQGQEYSLVDRSGKVFLASHPDKEGKFVKENAPALAALKTTYTAGTVRSFDPDENEHLLLGYAPFGKLVGMPTLSLTAIQGVDTQIAFAPQRQLLWIFALGTGLTAIAVAALAVYIANRATRPILAATEAVEKVGQGELDTRLEVKGGDELATLGVNINQMAGQLQDLLQAQEAEAQRQEAEAQHQRQQKEGLQQEVIKLLLEIEGAQKGDLTVKGQVTEGVVGSIADAFNTTIAKLRNLVLQAQTVSNQVNDLSQRGETSVRQLSETALTQADELNQALQAVAEMNTSIQSVAESATEAAKIAHQTLLEAQAGDSTMDKTVDSIDKIRSTVAGTAKKVKQLAESSQEISQIVGIISGISEKTNLLAFNASVEAARAGEHGQGFRVVADEVRRLADRVTESTKDIQILVSTIQQETAAVLQAMEQSTSEVVTGTELVLQTKQILQGLAQTSQEMDAYLQTISSSTFAQTQASQQVNQTMAGVATIAQENSSEAKDVVNNLKTLVAQAQSLQSAIAQFRVHA